MPPTPSSAVGYNFRLVLATCLNRPFEDYYDLQFCCVAAPILGYRHPNGRITTVNVN
jgi:hypothetical protein